MNNLCIIPARGGSKRIPRKNIKEFRGYPIIKWSIEAAWESAVFQSVVVSTDDDEIAKIAKNYGATVPYMRPRELSDDHTDTRTVVNHMIEEMNKRGNSYNFVCCLYATSPLIDSNYLREAIKEVQNEPDKTVFPVAKFSYPIQRALKRDRNGYTRFANREDACKRSQDLEERFHDAGQFYIAKPERWKNEKNILEGSKTILLPAWSVQDIDTEEDWIKAEIMHEILNRRKTA